MSKLTKEQLQGMSDKQINTALELKLNPAAEFVGNHYVETGDGIYENVIRYKSWPNYRECPDYCNTPNDIMPLAFEHKVSIFAYQDATLWVAQHYFDAVGMNTVIHENPLRAIACCLILVLQERS